MSYREAKGGMAFPCDIHEGMTLRDYFAGQAISGRADSGWVCREIAHHAYEIADVMIEARKCNE